MFKVKCLTTELPIQWERWIPAWNGDCEKSERSIFFSAVNKNLDFILFLIKKIFWLGWVFVAVLGLSLVVASRRYSSLQCTSFSLWWLLVLWSMGSRRAGLSSCGSPALECRLSSCGARA